MSNGKWVKYIDDKNATNRFFKRQKDGTRIVPFYEEIRCTGDTIIVPYKHNYYDKVDKGEFRFKWDNNAQWFGIEQVVY